MILSNAVSTICLLKIPGLILDCSNIYSLDGTVINDSILPAGAGNWTTLVYDGTTNWIKMAGNVN